MVKFFLFSHQTLKNNPKHIVGTKQLDMDKNTKQWVSPTEIIPSRKKKKHVKMFFFCVGANHTIAFSAQPRKAARICENGLDMFLHSSTAHYMFLSITDTYTHVNDVFPRSNVGRSHANHAPKPTGKLFFPGEMKARNNRLWTFIYPPVSSNVAGKSHINV